MVQKHHIAVSIAPISAVHYALGVAPAKAILTPEISAGH
jgi:hypothetical protein